MAVSILFPDNSIRDVPGQLIVRSNCHDSRTAFVQIPVNSDPMWRYCQVEGHWHAVPRHGGNVSILTPKPQAWWHSITQMQDRTPDAEAPGPAKRLRYISGRA
ncbi:hypothetical protein [Sphingobium aromaticiconvertens]|uniref:hypothetical protein n=1 Tax=Sphingobium aromaticiconvertens TaxID=365341 RepID=UPI00301A3E40